jgi:hypothetical protein
VGEITDVLTDPDDTEEVTADEVTGRLPKNFSVTYDGGEVINHLLMLDDYASSQETSGWCLLVPKRGGRKGRGSLRGGKGLGGSQLLPELTGVSPGTAVANMSAEQRAALRAALEAAEEEEEES